MGAIENIAWIVIVASAIKMIVLAVNPVKWMNFSKKIYAKPKVLKVVSFILAGVVLYYLLGAGITIVQILAVTTFVALLFAIGLAGEVDVIIQKYEDRIKKGENLLKKFWFYSLIWIVLLLWGLKELLVM